MSLDKLRLWERFKRNYRRYERLGLALDLSRVDFPEGFFDRMAESAGRAFEAMAALERGEIANPDEKRQVGHYWLRNPALAPEGLGQQIEAALQAAQEFTRKVHRGEIKGGLGKRFRNLLLIGIGGSALGPQFVAHALGGLKRDRMELLFFDNTDPDGFDRVLGKLRRKLDQTLCVVISKSGGTPETRNGMVEAAEAYREAGLKFANHAVAITMKGSGLDKRAVEEQWLASFPMWEWVGGRTSETSVVGLLPAMLQGIDVRGLLRGAKACDEVTRQPEVMKNPAMLLALAWYALGEGRGAKDMVVLPYKDRLELFSRYLQQLIMESLGKELDLQGRVVHQGLTVYGNKGSTDQHAYIQQLRDGLHNFFVLFIEVLKDREGRGIAVEEGVTSGDYLSGFFLGTRQALYEKGRQSLTLTIDEVSPFTVGVLIALFERTVGFYASLVNINAYHQPGVEAGKKAAGQVLELKKRVVGLLRRRADEGIIAGLTAEEIANELSAPGEAETVFKICEHLAGNTTTGIVRSGQGLPGAATYRLTLV